MSKNTRYTDSDYSALVKRVFGKLYDNMWVGTPIDPMAARINKLYNFPGNEMKLSVRLSLGGGVGGGGADGNILPKTWSSRFGGPTLTRKALYAVFKMDRQTMQAVKGEGAFKDAYKDEMEAKAQNFAVHYTRHCYGDGTGIAGQFSGNASGTAADPVLTILNTGVYGFVRRNWEEDDMITVNALSSLFRIVSVNETTREITLNRVSGSDDLTAIGAGTHSAYYQNTRNAAMMGIKGCFEYSGTFYGVTDQRRWRPLDIAAASAAISPEILIDAVTQQTDRTGLAPTEIVTSTKQMVKYLTLLEDQKRYPQDCSIKSGRDSKTGAAGTVSFPAIKFLTPKGIIPMYSSAFLKDDEVLLPNLNKVSGHYVQQAGWFDEDGAILGRIDGVDAYDARYGQYGEIFWNPFFQARIDGLAV
jgi:hypothetical protein